MCRNYISIFPFKRKFPLSRHDLNINSSGLQRETSQSLTIRIIIISWPWDLFGSRFLIIFRISSLVKQIVDSESVMSFLYKNCRKITAGIYKGTCFAKKVLHNSAFLLKFMINLFLCSNAGIQGIVWLIRNVFNIDQCDFGLVVGSNSFLDKRA